MSGGSNHGASVSGLAGGGFRLEIQALRAIAVLAVLVFHIWPSALPGGYVGVDVFFVISGYLITGILFRQFDSTGRIQVGTFYVRRIRRLLPAAAVVLIAVAFLLPLLPATRWEETVSGIVASTLYVQNWWLGAQAVDYLAAESAPSAVMHFWSLSVEEQYYIAWPLLLMLLGLLPAAVKRRPGRIFAAMVLLVVVASLAYSIWLTSTNPALAYFSTLTRAWELGVGGLLAVTTRWKTLPQTIRDALAWCGLAMIAFAVVRFDETTPFPGYAAALPVFGTALVIMGRDSPRLFSAYTLLRARILQYLGDISYSLYLWHWPVIVFYAAVAGRSPGLIDGIALLVVSCALAHQTKVLVEDRFRDAGDGPSASVRAFALAVFCILACLAAAWAATRPWDANREGGVGVATSSPDDRPTHPGALVLTDNVVAAPAEILPSPEHAKKDFPAPYLQRCMARGSSSKVEVCAYGNPHGETHVVLVGDTYAAQWQPALDSIAAANGWRLHVIVKTGCALGDAMPVDSDGNPSASCQTWREAVSERIREWKPDLLLIAQSPSSRVAAGGSRNERVIALAESMATFANRVAADTGSVAFLRGTPSLGRACAEVDNIGECEVPRSRALTDTDPALLASRNVAGAHLLDLSDAFCLSDRCGAVVGNVPVYRTGGHLTATYSRTLAPALARAVAESTGMQVSADIPSVEQSSGLELAKLALRAKSDNPEIYAKGCHVLQAPSEPKFCRYGPEDAEISLVLTGDSHAGHWEPAVQELAERNGWALYTFTKSACAFSDTTVTSGGREYKACSEWNRKLMDILLDMRPDAVVMSQSRGHVAFGVDRSESQEVLARGLTSRWRTLRDNGIGVAVIGDTPWMAKNVPDCVSTPGIRVSDCDTPLERALRSPDSILLAIEQGGAGVEFVNMNEYICEGGNCPAVRDGQVIWRDRHHLTATFARTLAPHLEPVIKRAVEH
ncbi:MAG: acyltransferase family protein [Luteimonas sp.]